MPSSVLGVPRRTHTHTYKINKCKTITKRKAKQANLLASLEEFLRLETEDIVLIFCESNCLPMSSVDVTKERLSFIN